MSSRTLTQAEFLAEAKAAFGDDPMAWAFRCPNCGDVATGQDFRDALTEHPREHNGEPMTASSVLGQECIGRTLGALEGQAKKWTGRGCDWAAYGLFRGPVDRPPAGRRQAPRLPAGRARPVRRDPMTTTEHAPKPPTVQKCEPSAAVVQLVPPSEVQVGDLGLFVQGDLSEVLAISEPTADETTHTRFVVAHEMFPGGQGDVYVRKGGLVAVQRYVTGQDVPISRRAALDELRGEWDEFLNELLENTDEAWDADEAMEAIVLRYVRCLEGLTERYLGRLPVPGDCGSTGRSREEDGRE